MFTNQLPTLQRAIDPLGERLLAFVTFDSDYGIESINVLDTDTGKHRVIREPVVRGLLNATEDGYVLLA